MEEMMGNSICNRESLPGPLTEKREKMVENQIEGRGIDNKELLHIFRKVPRHLFVPEDVKERAYDDCPLPIGNKQTISQPYMVALMTDALKLKGGEKVLELGTGSGYQAAILCEMASKVFSVERFEELARKAEGIIIHRLGYGNISIHIGDGTLGLPEHAPFDRIIITAATPKIPTPLVEQLRDGGIIVAPVGTHYHQELVQGIKKKGRLLKSYLGGCRFVKLVGKYGFQN